MTEEEAALLAELRAISNNSASANRFDDMDDQNENGNVDATSTKEYSPRTKSSPKNRNVTVERTSKVDLSVDQLENSRPSIDRVKTTNSSSKDHRGTHLTEERPLSASSVNSDSEGVPLSSYRKSVTNSSSPASVKVNERIFTPKRSDGTPPWRKKGVESANPIRGQEKEESLQSPDLPFFTPSVQTPDEYKDVRHRSEPDDLKYDSIASPTLLENKKEDKLSSGQLQDAGKNFNDSKEKVSSASSKVPLSRKFQSKSDSPPPSTTVKEMSLSSFRKSKLSPDAPIFDDAQDVSMTDHNQGFKNLNSQSSFKGERGGAAEDEALLAELRAISMRSAGDRFADVNDELPSQESKIISPAKVKRTLTRRNSPVHSGNLEKKTSETNLTLSASPPKRNAFAEILTESAANTTNSSEIGLKSFNAPSTFKGERGGAAEDEELLAQLRAISFKSTEGRFDNDDDNNSPTGRFTEQLAPTINNRAPVTKHSSKSPSKILITNESDKPWKKHSADISSQNTSSRVQMKSIGLNSKSNTIELPPFPVTQSTVTVDDDIVKEDNVIEHLGSQNWKLRKAAYDVLLHLMIDKTNGLKGENKFAGGFIHECLDSALPAMLRDSNASALDSALRLTFYYADFCIGGSQPSHVVPIVDSIVSGPAMSASRPSTSKLTECVLLKLMEVGRDGPSSVHITVEMLLTHGLPSKSPKVVSKAINLILEASRCFGAANLPLSQVTKHASFMLKHASGEVRDNGLQILVEICRAVGSKDPLASVIEEMRSAQVTELDAFLKEQPDSYPPSVGLRYFNQFSDNGAIALDLLNAETEKDVAARYAAREPVNIFASLDESEYKSKIKEDKWSEKAAALDILLRCGGNQPYKLVQPSNSINYIPLISELKKLLKHTHFAVKNKSLASLGMLAEGVGEKLFSHLRPLVPVLLDLTKDKKVAKSVEDCLDSMFGNVVSFRHLLEKDDGIQTHLDEKKEKNVLVRVAALSYLRRCIERSRNPIIKESIDRDIAMDLTQIAIKSIGDSDANVRKEASSVLAELISYPDENVKGIALNNIDSLERSNPRVFKLLTMQTSDKTLSTSALVSISPSKPHSYSKGPQDNRRSEASVASKRNSNLPDSFRSSGTRRSNLPNGFSSKPHSSTNSPTKLLQATSKSVEVSDTNTEETIIPDISVAMDYLSSLSIPLWDADEEDGGVLAGILSTNWKYRKSSLESLLLFSRTEKAKSDGSKFALNLMVVVNEKTKQMQDSNFNISKAAFDVVLGLCDLYESIHYPMDIWIAKMSAVAAVNKVADKKFASVAPILLTRLCEVQYPQNIFIFLIGAIEDIKSPLPHESLLSWVEDFCKDFGASSIGKSLNLCVCWALKECESGNPKVKAGALSLLTQLYIQLGPAIKAIVLSTKNDAVRSMVQTIMDSTDYDPASQHQTRVKQCLLKNHEITSQKDVLSSGIEIPKTDIMSILPLNVFEEMASNDGKDAWKKRKAALDEVELVCSKYNGLMSTTSEAFSGLVELARALKLRLKDSQSNLKPVAARNLSIILNSVDSQSQSKLGRIVYGPLINAALSDNKKIVRDACLDALQKGTMRSEVNGNNPNCDAAEPLISAFVTEVEETDFKAVGLPDVLQLLLERVAHFRSYDDISSTSKAKSVYVQFAKCLVGCLMAPKSESRSGAEALLKSCIEHRILTLAMVEKPVSRMTVAEQKSVQSILDSIRNMNQIDRITGSPANRGPNQSLLQESDEVAIPKAQSNSSSRLTRKSLGGDVKVPKNNLGTDYLLVASKVNPLKSSSPSSSAAKRQRCSHSARQKDSIPDFPTEPTGSDVFDQLKKTWSNYLPTESVEILFPSRGFKNQDDSASGVRLLTKAISMCESEGEEFIFVDQLDLIIRWYTIALCCRESTSGMESLMSFIENIVSSLSKLRYELTDVEAGYLLPYIIEKAATAKGRFKDKVRHILDSVLEYNIYPASKYGSAICVLVMESGKTSKSRSFAAWQAQLSIERSGLNAIGKKGIQAAAKAFSEENTPEHKSVYLDLVEVIIVNMNGDVSKFFKICGPSIVLTRNAKQLIEERMAKSDKRPVEPQSSGKISNQSNFLSISASKSSSPPSSQVPQENPADADGPFKFSYESNHAVSNRSVTSTSSVFSQSIQNKRAESSGTAAALRERLQYIRTKHQSDNDDTAAIDQSVPDIKGASESALYHEILKKVRVLLSLPTPFTEIDGRFTGALVGLRQLHSSLSNNGVDNSGTSDNTLRNLRQHVQNNVSECIEILTKVLEFGFKCGTPSSADGLSVPLLSVSIAGLMAIFLDSTFSAKVSLSSLSIVIFQSTLSLLDRRLSSSSTVEESGLDASTCKKMVKAINKLAIQASYGCMRHISFITLISLQLRLCSSPDEDKMSSDQRQTNQRMSRIITKLFARVIKAEESEKAPFTSRQTDVEAILIGTEQVLVKCNSIVGITDQSNDESTLTDPASLIEVDKLAPCKDMIHTLITELIKAKSAQDSMQEFKCELENNGLNQRSHTGKLVSCCCLELGLTPIYNNDEAAPIEQEKNYDSDYLSELIYAVGRAGDDDDRVTSMDDLRDYLGAHKEIDIESHLSGLSAPFRKYILDQLRSPFRPLMSAESLSMLSGISSVASGNISSRSVTSALSDTNSHMSMSEKLKFLKSKIHAAEATAQSAMNSNISNSVNEHTSASITTNSHSNVVGRNNKSDSESGVSSLRQRLAAATEKAKANSPEQSQKSASRPSSAIINAASLRARLESVRRLDS